MLVPKTSITDNGFAYQLCDGRMFAAFLGPKGEIPVAAAWRCPSEVVFAELEEPSFDRLTMIRFQLAILTGQEV